jgi:hypothetical protein
MAEALLAGGTAKTPQFLHQRALRLIALLSMLRMWFSPFSCQADDLTYRLLPAPRKPHLLSLLLSDLLEASRLFLRLPQLPLQLIPWRLEQWR